MCVHNVSQSYMLFLICTFVLGKSLENRNNMKETKMEINKGRNQGSSIMIYVELSFMLFIFLLWRIFLEVNYNIPLSSGKGVMIIFTLFSIHILLYSLNKLMIKLF